MRVELTRVRVKQGKSARVDEWLKMLNDNMNEVIQTLDREQMKVEVIFREMIDGEEYLYEECIDHKYGAHDAQSQVVMVPPKIAQAMDWDNPPVDIVNFEHREIVHRHPE